MATQLLAWAGFQSKQSQKQEKQEEFETHQHQDKDEHPSSSTSSKFSFYPSTTTFPSPSAPPLESNHDSLSSSSSSPSSLSSLYPSIRSSSSSSSSSSHLSAYSPYSFAGPKSVEPSLSLGASQVLKLENAQLKHAIQELQSKITSSNSPSAPPPPSPPPPSTSSGGMLGSYCYISPTGQEYPWQPLGSLAGGRAQAYAIDAGAFSYTHPSSSTSSSPSFSSTPAAAPALDFYAALQASVDQGENYASNLMAQIKANREHGNTQLQQEEKAESQSQAILASDRKLAAESSMSSVLGDSMEWWTLVHADGTTDYLIDDSTQEPHLTPDKVVDEGWVLLDNDDFLNALSDFIAKSMLTHPESKKLTPDQINKMLNESMAPLKDPTTMSRMLSMGKTLYHWYGWGSTLYTVYKEPVYTRLIVQGFWSVASWIVVLLL